jgi:hypothetical protein
MGWWFGWDLKLGCGLLAFEAEMFEPLWMVGFFRVLHCVQDDSKNL